MALSRAVISSINSLDEELLERVSSNIVHEERNMVLQTEPCQHVLLNQHSDGFPIITSVFSLAPSTTAEVQTENHHLNMDSQHSFQSFAPSISRTVIPNTFNSHEKGNNSLVVSSFVINNCHQVTAIPVSSQTRTTEIKSENINLGFQNFLRGCYIIAGSDTKLSNLMPVNGTGKNVNHSESQLEVLDKKVEENAINFGSKLPSPRSSKTRNCITAEQPDLIAMCNTADATNVGTMTDREERIRRLKNLLRQKEAEVEKIRFLSKKSTLSATIDKIKLRLSTENDSLSYLDRK